MNNDILDNLMHAGKPKLVRTKLVFCRSRNTRSLTGSRRHRSCFSNHRINDDFESFRLMVVLRPRYFYNAVTVTLPTKHSSAFNKFISFRNNLQIKRSFKPSYRAMYEVTEFHKRTYFER